MIAIRTPSRLHFGLFNAGGPGVARRFGGLGLMIDQPGLAISLETAAAWQVEGPLSDRVGNLIETLRAAQPQRFPQACRVRIHHAAAEHTGLGTGTQLTLGVARLFAEAYGWPERTGIALAALVERGRRSAVGLCGFDRGGFIVDEGQCSRVEPIAFRRIAFPETWRIVLICAEQQTGLHGASETDVFAQASSAKEADHDREMRGLASTVERTLLAECFDEFSTALHSFNRAAGERFRTVQQGVYANAWTAEVIAALKSRGVSGVGQSSWGPTVFAVASDSEHAEWIARPMRAALAPGAVKITTANQNGYTLSTER